MRSGVLALAICLVAAASRTSFVGYADLPRLLAAHPLHKVLDAYDREIAALRDTRAVVGLGDPAAGASGAAAAVRRDATEAQGRVARIATGGAARDRGLEAHALSAVRASRFGAESAMNAYGGALSRETEANLRGFESAIAQQTSRALAARQQQLREKELALAYDLARRDGATRLELRLKLTELHLDPPLRARLAGQLAALSRRQAAAVAALHAQNAGLLARYREQLNRSGAAAVAQMATQLRSKAEANLALRLGVLRAASSSAEAVPNLPARLESFGSSYRLGSDAAAIQSGLSAAASDLPRRFALLAATERASRVETSAQIENLQRDRAQLYRAMVAQIQRDARRLGQERGLRVVVSGSRPKGSVDVTGTLAREESSF